MKPNSVKTTFIIIGAALLLSVTSCKKTEQATSFCKDINENTTWKNDKDGVDIIVSCPINVDAQLTIEPGTEIEFEGEAGILIGMNGAIKAIGTANEMITLRGKSDTKGAWKGIAVKSNNVANELKYCNITGGGQSGFDGNNFKAGILIGLNAKLKIANCVVSKSGKDGLYVEGFDSDFENPINVFSSNTFSDNANYPLSILASSVNSLDGTGSTYSNNGKNFINVRGGRMYGDHVWNKTNAPILISGYTIAGYYNDQGNLTVNPGVKIVFAADQGLAVGEYSNGYVSMIGNANAHVELTGENAAPGAWKGICFQSINASNRLSYVDISYGGSSSFTGNGSHLANIVIGGSSTGKASIDNCTVSHSAAYGILIGLNNPEPTISNVTYSDNASDNYYVEQ